MPDAEETARRRQRIEKETGLITSTMTTLISNATEVHGPYLKVCVSLAVHRPDGRKVAEYSVDIPAT